MGKTKRLRKNPAAIFAFILTAISGFTFSLFNTNFFGETIPNKGGVIINLITNLFTKDISFNKGYETLIFIMVVSYLFILFLYFLNGFGIVYNRYSRYASYISFAYLFFGLYAVVLINRETSLPIFGNSLGSISAGLGTYFLPIIGTAYLFFKRKINSKIHF